MVERRQGQQCDHKLLAPARLGFSFLPVTRDLRFLTRPSAPRMPAEAVPAQLDPGQNEEVFGPLSDPRGHPHDYRCAVTVSGPIDDRMGMVVDLVALDSILQEESSPAGREASERGRAGTRVRSDAAHLRGDRDGRVPPDRPRLPRGVTLERVRIMEDPTLYADCTGLR